MVNTGDLCARSAVLLLAAAVLIGAAWLRGAEYDEQYTMFLTAGTARPAWPRTVFPAGTVATVQGGQASLAAIAGDLRATDVHPPLYFWAISLWRQLFGPGLFAARMLSVLCGIVSIALVGILAGRCRTRPAVAMALTLGCYAFVYTNAIARSFAAAEMLTLCGVVLLLDRRRILAGLCFGAACGCNYLAVFVAAAVLLAAGSVTAALAMMPFLALDAWFFAAQHAARPDQFPPFAMWPSVVRLVEYQVAAVFGGLPLYVDGHWRFVTEAALGLLAVGLVVLVGRARLEGARRIVLAAAIAPPVGLLLLGALFDNAPIELRYLSFGLPFVALLIAISDSRHRVAALVLGLQVLAIAGLLLSPRTMQPARFAAHQAARLAADAIVLVPAGNDGVGIVGAFGIEAPPALPILLIHPNDAIADRIAPYGRVALAVLPQDRDSTAAIAAARAALVRPNWRPTEIGSNLEVYERGE